MANTNKIDTGLTSNEQALVDEVRLIAENDGGAYRMMRDGASPREAATAAISCAFDEWRANRRRWERDVYREQRDALIRELAKYWRSTQGSE